MTERSAEDPRPNTGRGYHLFDGGNHWALQGYAPGLFMGHYVPGDGPEQVWLAPRPWKGHLSTEELLEHIRKMYYRSSLLRSNDNARYWPVIIPDATWKQVARNIQLKKDGFIFAACFLGWLGISRSVARWNPVPGSRFRANICVLWFAMGSAYFTAYVRSFRRLAGYRENDFELAVYGPAFPEEVADLKRKREDAVLRKMMVMDILESGSSTTKALNWENPLVQRHHIMFAQQIKEYDDAQAVANDYQKEHISGKFVWRSSGDASKPLSETPLYQSIRERAAEQAKALASGTFKQYYSSPGLAGERHPTSFGADRDAALPAYEQKPAQVPDIARARDPRA